MSIDIDLFTDQDYSTVDFDAIESYLLGHFHYVDPNFGGIASFGKSYLIGTDAENTIKLDIYYSNEKFLDPALEMDGVRMASVEDIIAMKLDVVMFGGRKNDFWDLHELLPDYSIADMMALHARRCEYMHDAEAIQRNFTDFTGADQDFDPICLRNRQWVFIKRRY
ncbi:MULTISPECIES: nucleotidyl transferase AbiEii/AbiGii toxin family protein [Flavobacterium]|uniref:nucleotidyl transferase AbiEii/AbiGii toxin family protein n=1 Tax=Flavobacterium TaxID=237 RepID=UPI0021157253|nr:MULTISPECIES: nucleotidyl transferase AbiEii/AbiGii toxin family protein [Flavobacterium]UUF12391.1 nucleotidyl transferase AbiEii/AbiGii toxin family protein [Flavobacterium panici]